MGKNKYTEWYENGQTLKAKFINAILMDGIPSGIGMVKRR